MARGPVCGAAAGKAGKAGSAGLPYEEPGSVPLGGGENEAASVPENRLPVFVEYLDPP